MLTDETLALIAAAETSQDEAGALAILRKLSVDSFGELLLDVSGFPFLASFLPQMAPEKVQQSWTGASGMDLLKNSTAPFIRCVEENYAAARRAPLQNVNVLDYGCGWGRITRMMLKYTNADRIWALDPLEVSLKFCRDAGVRANLRQCDPIPSKLPIDAPLDLCVAFSVFTHTSERVTRASLRAMHEASAPGAVLVFTIRPVEFWNLRKTPELAAAHRATGFSFLGDGRILVEGEDTYGHASMNHSRAESIMNDAGWTLFRFDHSLNDEYQTRVIGIRS